jgi:hypothetical protein
MQKLLTGIFLALTISTVAAQEREWVLDAAEEDVYLLFGVPNTTDVGVSLWCKISTGNISLFAPMPTTTPAPEIATLTIRNTNYELALTKIEGDMQYSIEAKLIPQDKILDALQSAEQFSLTLGKHTSVYPLATADFAGLLRLCKEKPEVPNN